MAKVLTQILERLRGEPANAKLISRFLAIVADVTDEKQKAAHTLDLARVVQEGDPVEAMRYAHMVYRAHPTNLEALEIVVECLTSLGRLGKAEVLRNEISRLKALQDVSVHPNEDRPVIIPPPSRRPPPEKKKDEHQALSAREEPQTPSTGESSLSSRRLPLPEASDQDIMRDFFGSEDSEPSVDLGRFKLEAEPGAEEASGLFPAGEGTDGGTDPGTETGSLANSLAAAAEMFDHYWQQGFIKEAQEILNQSAAASSGEHWWKARHALISKSRTGRGTGVPKPLAPEPSNPLPSVPLTPLEPAAGQGSLAALRQELAEAHRPEQKAECFAKLLQSTDSLPQHEQVAAQWDLVQGLWGVNPDAVCAEYLVASALHDLNEGFWGVYLDALLASGRARAAFNEIRRGLSLHPTLTWARCCFPRLVKVAQALDLKAPQWSEDDGVAALLGQVASRPPPSFKGLMRGRETTGPKA